MKSMGLQSDLREGLRGAVSLRVCVRVPPFLG